MTEEYHKIHVEWIDIGASMTCPTCKEDAIVQVDLWNGTVEFDCYTCDKKIEIELYGKVKK